MMESDCDSFTCRLIATSFWEHALGGSSGVVMSLSCVVMGSPTEDEKCRSIT